MRLLPRSVLLSARSIFSLRKEKDKQDTKGTAAPTVPAPGASPPSPSVPIIGGDIPTSSAPGIGTDISIPSVTALAKDLPPTSAADVLKNTPTSDASSILSPTDANASPTTVTTTITISATDTSTVTSASITVTIIQHDLGTVASTIPTTVTNTGHDPSTVATTVLMTLTTTQLIATSTSPLSSAHPTPTPMLAAPEVSSGKKSVEPAVILSVVFGLVILGLLGVICFLVLKCRRLVKARLKTPTKRYADEFEWPQARAVEGERDEEGGAREDEWGPKQKEAWGVV